jgi:hypothetical protein
LRKRDGENGNENGTESGHGEERNGWGNLAESTAVSGGWGEYTPGEEDGELVLEELQNDSWGNANGWGESSGSASGEVGGVRMISINRCILKLLRGMRRFKPLDGRCEEIANARLEILLWSFASFEFGNGEEVFTWSIWTKVVSGFLKGCLVSFLL